MQLSDFKFDLPDELIARYPLPERTDSRLLCLPSPGGEVSHHVFDELPALLNPGDLLVFNDTRVIPARLFGHKQTGGRVEILIERVTGSHSVVAQMRASKSLVEGSEITLERDSADHLNLTIGQRQGQFYEIKFPEPGVKLILDRFGHVPLPPYIDRTDDAEDLQRYQTVYARKDGAVAAPTAGLHFDEQLLAKLDERGIGQAFVTLHVGAGTFQPVRVDNIEEHVMHSESIEVNQTVCQQVRDCKSNGGRVVAVGTTSVRCLETAAASGEINPFSGETNIFIYPPYEFRCVDILITNFHLPGSSLIMLVSAFAGLSSTMRAYQEAIAQQYRFYSYGDAMLIHKVKSQNQD
jgi:S-adenosylmethionine:tRNA ribosyltransferase-isomerase